MGMSRQRTLPHGRVRAAGSVPIAGAPCDSSLAITRSEPSPLPTSTEPSAERPTDANIIREKVNADVDVRTPRLQALDNWRERVEDRISFERSVPLPIDRVQSV